MRRHQEGLPHSVLVDGEARTKSLWDAYNSDDAMVISIKGFPTSSPANNSLSMSVWRGAVVRGIPSQRVRGLDPVPLILPASRGDLITDNPVCRGMMNNFFEELVLGINEGDEVDTVTVAGSPQRQAFLRAAGLEERSRERVSVRCPTP